MNAWLPVLSVWLMLVIGLGLIVLEVLLAGTFVILWFGVAFILVGLAGLWIAFPAGEYQLIAVAVLGTLLLWALRKRAQAWFAGSEPPPAETYEAGDIGELQQHEGQWMVYYRGTWWRLAEPVPDPEPGQRVRVTALEGNRARVERLDQPNDSTAQSSG
ncbi:NfeD family protein [Sulfurivirga sp.]|uniref:NfeD family protein n=1 Tax=Sulfurivirga sp. TaxID=2614236 RepID=UPI0025F0B80A|nr:NfeD family protein [Sulfurivirga sp.]